MSDLFIPSSTPSRGLMTISAALDRQRRRSEWNDRFAHWERPASVTEEGTIERAQSNVLAAISGNRWLNEQTVQILPQGSYYNNTNVRTEADIDLRALHPAIKIQYHHDVNLDAARFILPYSDYGLTFDQIFETMRAELTADFSMRFGPRNVVLGNKAIRIKGITGSRAEVDVVPAINFHYVTWVPHQSTYHTLNGVAILSSSGSWTLNFPLQHTVNGIAKRARTAHRFKRIVRIFKRMRADMADRGLLTVKVPSFLVECLVYSVEDQHFLVEADDRYDRVRRVARRIQEMVSTDFVACRMTEVNEIKSLFHRDQAWTRETALLFADAVLHHLGDS